MNTILEFALGTAEDVIESCSAATPAFALKYDKFTASFADTGLETFISRLLLMLTLEVAKVMLFNGTVLSYFNASAVVY